MKRHGEKQVEAIKSLDLTGSKINRFESIPDGFPGDLWNNEPQKELKYTLGVEKEVNRYNLIRVM